MVAVAVVVTLLVTHADDDPAGERADLTPALHPEQRLVAGDPRLAWANTDSAFVEDAVSVGDTVIVLALGRDTTELLTAYDVDGATLWEQEVTDVRALETVTRADGAPVVLAYHDRELQALDAATGEEQWSFTGDDPDRSDEFDLVSPPDEPPATGPTLVDGRIAVEYGWSPPGCVDEECGEAGQTSAQVSLVAPESGEETLTVEGELAAVTPTGLLTRMNEDLTWHDLDGSGRWSVTLDDAYGVDLPYDDAIEATDELVLVGGEHDGGSFDSPGILLALDADSGKELWRENTRAETIAAGPDDTLVAVLRPEATDSALDPGDGSTEIALYDADGQVAERDLGDIDRPARPQLLATDDGDLLIDLVDGTVYDDRLEVTASPRLPAEAEWAEADVARNGMYLLSRKPDLALPAPEGEETPPSTLVAVGYDGAEPVASLTFPTALQGVWALDGAVLVDLFEGGFRLYR